MVADNHLEEAKVNFFLCHCSFFSLFNVSCNSTSFGLGAFCKAFFIPEEVIFEVSIRAEPQFRRLNDRY